jgi:hypothetical protein
LNLQKAQHASVPAETRARVAPRVPPTGGTALALPPPKASDDAVACTDAFLGDLRAMCALIGEADRYGATRAMEEEYRRLRTELSIGYRALLAQLDPSVLPPSGFHGCGFEMILGNYSLEGLVRNSGRRAVERLTEVWRQLCPTV